jgi:hypothetical protein
MQVYGKCIWKPYPEPSQHYGVVNTTHYNELRRPEDDLACTLPCFGPGQAIADARELAKLITQQN